MHSISTNIYTLLRVYDIHKINICLTHMKIFTLLIKLSITHSTVNNVLSTIVRYMTTHNVF